MSAADTSVNATDRRVIFLLYPIYCVLVMRKWHRNRVANVMDAAKNLSIFYSDEVIESLFSNIRGGVERECVRQGVPPSCSIESEHNQLVLTMTIYGSI